MNAKRIRMGGPQGVTRPYSTLPATDDPAEQAAQALDHIATAVSAIDHNLEMLASNSKQQTQILARMSAFLEVLSQKR